MSRYIKVEDMRAIFCQSNSLTQAWNGFDMLSSIDIEPKRGEWIDNRGASDKSQLFPFECSECHDVNERTTNFCPNCGAQMKGADDEYDK